MTPEAFCDTFTWSDLPKASRVNFSPLGSHPQNLLLQWLGNAHYTVLVRYQKVTGIHCDFSQSAVLLRIDVDRDRYLHLGNTGEGRLAHGWRSASKQRETRSTVFRDIAHATGHHGAEYTPRLRTGGHEAAPDGILRT
jgi:hypothetical protein